MEKKVKILTVFFSGLEEGVVDNIKHKRCTSMSKSSNINHIS